MKIYEKAALITAARVAKKPIAFLVGSPISNENGVGVPGVGDILDCVREEITESASSELPKFEAEIAGKQGSDAYQAAMTWVQGYLLQDAVNSIIARAVLKARNPKSSKDFSEDGVPEDWNIPSGVHQLAWLVCQNRDQFPGPVMTTNFDPLLSLAVTANGGNPVLRVILADGNLTYNVKQAGQVEIIHLHGYWRGTDTMHTPGQLTAPRPRLKESLKSILHKHTLIVVAYGGWDDIFAQALSEAVQDSATDINVLWCFRGDNLEVEKYNNPALFQRISPLLISGRFNAYGNINCHTIFEEISAALPKKINEENRNDTGIEKSPLLGWQLLTSAFLNNLPALSSEETIRYFDGAIPSLRHAISKDIPRREKVSELSALFNEAVSVKDAASLQLIRAAGGEGKTTILLQTAVDAVMSGKWKVVWRNSPLEGLPLADVEKLDKTFQWLIVADDADNIVEQIANAVKRLHNIGSTNVHFLLASRDADWRSAKGDRKSWEQWLIKRSDCFLRSISSDDAKIVVKAWGKFGPVGLRSLASTGKLPERALKLLNAVWDADRDNAAWGSPGDGSFFGGLLEVRFGQGGLRAHVLEFLKRLQAISISESSNASTLLDALLYISACHGVGLHGLDSRILADLVGVPRDWIHSRVVRLLGAEAGATDSGGYIFTRHSKVAAAIIVEAERSFGVDFSEVWMRLVKQTAEASQDPYFDSKSYIPILNAGPKLQNMLPSELSEERRKIIAIAAARAAVTAEPNKVRAITSLGKTYRNAQEFQLAVSLFRDNYRKISSAEDCKLIRGYVSEWTISESESGKELRHVLASAWLAGLSLSDIFNPISITPDDILIICSSFGIIFNRLEKYTGEMCYGFAVRAAAFIGRLAKDDPRGNDYFDRYDRFADQLNVPYLDSVDEAIDWIQKALYQVKLNLQEQFLIDIADGKQISFENLKAVSG
ncbi:P-loop NTPase [Hymenobacter crusticola]|uniref:Novel STAND NTPase 5 domain-containing protein n=1 Tax=Hymenobacter crusticola TaxID=1770526 RepID=A0A243W8D0_9BACT|nr:SIR2 family protein [Hymenobacter crusticola]OUJ69402.1 hypothetical protein BXP70_26565 [Hymenobacter crusticola]